MHPRRLFDILSAMSWSLPLSLTLIACGDSGTPSDPDGGSGGADAGISDASLPPPCYFSIPVTLPQLSLAPAYQLTPRASYDRFTIDGQAMEDADFTTPGVQVSVADKMDALTEAINLEH